MLSKTASVITNDPTSEKISLGISGRVKKFVKVIPKRLKLSGSLKESLKSEARIVPMKEFPFKIKGVSAKKDLNITYGLKALASGEYRLTVENRAVKPGRYFDTVVLKTDSKERPTIDVIVYGNITE